jgi:hypothetical protein
MSSVSDIKDQLVIILGAVSGVDKAFDRMPRYLDFDPGTKVMIGMYYDGATYDVGEIGGEWAHYKFTIIAFIYMYDEVSIQEVQEVMGEDLLAALRAKPDLNNSCLFFNVEELANGEYNSANGNVYATIAITLIADKEEDY